MTSTVRRYSLDDFMSIAQDGFRYSISSATHDIIHALAKEVGAPDYVRTPVFSSNREKPRHSHRNRRKIQEITDEDWEDIRTFQSREKSELSDNEKLIRSLRDKMNRITVKADTEETIVNLIIEHVEQSLLLNCSEHLMDTFFATLVSNPLNLESYAGAIAKLILEVESEKSTVVRVVVENLRKFIDYWHFSYDSIREVNEEDDFDLFCDLNKQNDLRVRKAKFIAFLFDLLHNDSEEGYEYGENQIVLHGIIIRAVDTLIDRFQESLITTNCSYQADQIGASILELVSNSDLGNIQLNSCDGETAMELIQQVVYEGRKAYPSLSNKLLFKLMDKSTVSPIQC